MAEVDRELQEKYLEILVGNGGFQSTKTFFPYTSGQIGPYYIDLTAIQKNGEDHETACFGMYSLVNGRVWRENIDVISGGQTKDWMFSLYVARKLIKGHTMIQKDGEIRGETELKGKRIVHVADLNNEGSSVRDLWIPKIRDAGGTIENIFFYVDRMEDGVQIMEDLGLRSHSLVQLDGHVWDYLLKKGVIDKEVYSSLRARMEDKDSWAKNMLKSREGIETLARLPEEKRNKIIKVYSLE